MKRIFLLLCGIPVFAMAQPLPVVNVFPSLSILAHSRGWAMGGTGIASSVDNQSVGYNIARAAFNQNFHQASFTYLPWMRSIASDSRLMHADYAGSVGSSSAVGFEINFLDLGSVAIRDNNGATLGLYRSNEFNLGGSYALQLGGNASLGATMRLIGSRYYSESLQNQYSVCGDIGYYQFADIAEGLRLEWGATVRNLGAAINLPGIAGIGIGVVKHVEGNGRLAFTVDASRLLKDEWNGVRVSTGAEYVFDETFAIRCGASMENKLKGNRKYFSLGVGYKGYVSDQSWAVDLHYLIPFGMTGGVSPYQNAFGLTLSLNIGNFQ